jgi:hypothetical protein
MRLTFPRPQDAQTETAFADQAVEKDIRGPTYEFIGKKARISALDFWYKNYLIIGFQ